MRRIAHGWVTRLLDKWSFLSIIKRFLDSDILITNHGILIIPTCQLKVGLIMTIYIKIDTVSIKAGAMILINIITLFYHILAIETASLTHF